MKQQFARLKRHYKNSLNHYDIISFLDLAHTLRIWTEMKVDVDRMLSKPNFKTSVFTNSLKKILHGSEYVFTHLPDGVTTSAAATGEVGKRNLTYGSVEGSFSVATLMKIEKNRDLSIAQFVLVNRVMSASEISKLHKAQDALPIEKVSFSKYLDKPAIHFHFSDQQSNHIPNEQLIKRIANEYKGSHAEVANTNFEISNIFSEPTKRLMQHGCAQLPLPYFVLLHIAESIIVNLKDEF